MYKTYIDSEQYAALKNKKDNVDMEEMMEDHDYPVDLNYACVATDKDDPDNLEEAHELNLERFGLTEAGV